jgi:hypothetical protein
VFFSCYAPFCFFKIIIQSFKREEIFSFQKKKVFRAQYNLFIAFLPHKRERKKIEKQ